MKFWLWLLFVLTVLGFVGGLLGLSRFLMTSIIIVVTIGALVVRGVNLDFKQHDLLR